MAKLENLFKQLLGLEFNSPNNALHWNEGENGWTFMGIYEYEHPSWSGWDIVNETLTKHGRAKGSVLLYYDTNVLKLVEEFYKRQFWDKMRLDEVVNQEVANEMMVFAVNAGIMVAVKIAQKLVGATVDGVLGSRTIAALNKVDSAWFDAEYDKEEIKHYEKLVASNPTFKKYINGWKNRAIAI